jgi:hypothetical protein
MCASTVFHNYRHRHKQDPLTVEFILASQKKDLKTISILQRRYEEHILPMHAKESMIFESTQPERV